MKKALTAIVSVLILSLLCGGCLAGSWTPPGPDPAPLRVCVKESTLSTRSGPATEYTGCGNCKGMLGKYVDVHARWVDDGGVTWVEVDIEYGRGAYRRVWVGVRNLQLSDRQLAGLPYDHTSFLGYGTVTERVSPRMGPGLKYVPYSDRDFTPGTSVAVIASDGGYYMVERKMNNRSSGTQEILRCWISKSSVRLN